MWERVHASMLHWYRLVGRGSEGAHTLERDGLVAALVPAATERSVVNAVVYEHPGAVAEAYDDLASAYERIGANWTVWVHNGDTETAALLESKRPRARRGARGHGRRSRGHAARAAGAARRWRTGPRRATWPTSAPSTTAPTATAATGSRAR